MYATKKEAVIHSGTLSKPRKMPGKSWGIAALSNCKTGSALAKVEGSVCSDCYACKGQYGFKNVRQAHDMRKELSLKPKWISAMIKMVETESYFRWHDSGDLYSYEYLLKIMEVVRGTPNTKHWLPTKEKALIKRYLKEHKVIPSNLTVRISGAMVDGDAPKVDGINTSTVVTDGSQTCPAYSQGGECKDCRACWDSKVANVSYPKH